MKFIYLITPFILFHYTCSASTTLPWNIWKQEADLKVSYRNVDIKNYPKGKGLIEIKANITVNSSLSGFLLFIQDVVNTPRWLEGAKESRIMKKTSYRENSFLIVVSAIWPMKPRLLLLHSTFWQNKNLSVDISIKQQSQENQESLDTMMNDKLRDFFIVKVHYAHWHLTPVAMTSLNLTPQLNIEYIFIADGIGSAPNWLANKMTLKSIWQSMNNLKQQLPDSKWQQIKIDEIIEPTLDTGKLIEN